MSVFFIREMALKRGVTSAYQLMKKMDVSPSQAQRLWESEKLTALRQSTIVNICESLQCEPHEFIKYTPKSSGKGKR